MRPASFMSKTRKPFSKETQAHAKAHARWVIQATEKALKKHIGLIKKRERIQSIVAMMERLRGDIRKGDVRLIRRHLKKMNELTKGFAKRTLRRKIKRK